MALKHVLGVFGVIVFGIVEVAGLYHKFQGYVGQTEGNIILIIFFCLAGLTLFTYYKVITMSPGRATDLSGPYMESGRAADGKEMRYCQKCKCFKPERCHHCSDCNQCTLKMDHHCPWVNNCVGFKNYKYFYLLLLYAALLEIYCLVILVYCISRSAPHYGGWEYSSMVCVGVVALFSLGTLGLLVFHTHLMISNQTTIEQLKGLPLALYSLGAYMNVQMALGRSPLLWLFPCVWGVDVAFDGINWDHPAERPTIQQLESIGIDMHSPPAANCQETSAQLTMLQYPKNANGLAETTKAEVEETGPVPDEEQDDERIVFDQIDADEIDVKFKARTYANNL